MAGSGGGPQVLRIFGLIVVAAVFFVSIDLTGRVFGLLGADVASTLLATTSNPFVGLFIGILATALVQSSSTTTSLTVALVAGGGLTVSGAIPIIMGANIGTTITNNIVAFGHFTRREEFKRALAGATVHDFFNVMTVLVLFPLELWFGAVSRPATWLSSGVTGIGAGRLLSPVAAVLEPISETIIAVLDGSGLAVLAVGFVLLFGSIRLIVRLLRQIVFERTESMMHRLVFGTTLGTFAVGLVITVLVQSSSITTSVIVPLTAAGIVTVSQVFPFVMGANVGTTITALLAALALAAGGAASGEAALHAAFAHLVFNVLGVLLMVAVKPAGAVPVWLADSLGGAAMQNRGIAIAYLLTLFILLPLAVLLLARIVGAW